MIGHALKINDSLQTVVKENTKSRIEKRKCSRVSIRVPISCASFDSQARLLDHNKGIVRNVSQAGLRIEAENNAHSGRLKLAFADLNKSRVEITGKVVSSHKIERLTVIALIAVVSAIAVPNIFGVLPKHRISGSAREILSILHFAKMAAIKENPAVVVNFNPGSRDCTVYVDDGEGGATPGDQVRSGGERILKHYVLPSGVNLLTPLFGNALPCPNSSGRDETVMEFS